jgi:Anti-sigma factor NepR
MNARNLRLVWRDMTQEWDTTVINDEKPSEKARAIRARQRAIGRELRRMYDDVAQEPIPDEFMELLRKIDENDDKSGKKVS